MPKPLIADMPFQLDLDSGYTLRVTAVDPTTGVQVSGVNVSKVIIMAANLGDPGTVGDLEHGDWVLVPGPE